MSSSLPVKKLRLLQLAAIIFLTVSGGPYGLEPSAAINILGIVPVGKISLVLGTIVLLPFMVLFGTSLAQHQGHLAFRFPAFSGLLFRPSDWDCIR